MAGGDRGSVSLTEDCVCWCNGAVFAPSRTDECSLSCSVEASLELMLDSEADVSKTGIPHLGHSLEFCRLLDRNCRVGVLARSADLLSSLVVRRSLV